MIEEQGQYVPDKGRVPEAKNARARRSAASRVFYSLFVTFALLLLIGVAGGAYLYSVFHSAGPLTAEKTIVIEKDSPPAKIGELLDREGVIVSSELFALAGTVSGARSRLKPGEYAFKPKASMRDVLGAIASGRTVVYKLVVPEGFTTQMAIERVKSAEQLDGDVTLAPPEGSLMPATYDIRRGEPRDKVIARMMAAQTKLLDDLWAKRAGGLPVRSKEEAVVLASIVEKETGVAEERARVAAVFSNRLKKNMRLQSDPTIIYGIAGGKGRLDRALTKTDIAEKTAYNTYRINGLPPGPIANPGRAALEAVLNPMVSEDLYFVADGSGGHAFAATLEDHNANVKKWRDLEKNQAKVVEAEAEQEAAKAGAEPAADAPAAEAAAPPKDAAAEAALAADPPPPAPEQQPKPAAEAAPLPEPPPEPPAGADTEQVASADPAAAPPEKKADEPKAEDPPKTIMPDPEADLGVPSVDPPPPAVEEALLEPKPGSLVRVAKRTVPIPMPKPKKK